MAVYMVGYDLKSGENYKPLLDYLKSFPTRWHCLDSTWLVETNMTVAELRSRCAQHMYTDDKLLVLRYVTSGEKDTGSSAWAGFEGKCHTWLETNT